MWTFEAWGPCLPVGFSTVEFMAVGHSLYALVTILRQCSPVNSTLKLSGKWDNLKYSNPCPIIFASLCVPSY